MSALDFLRLYFITSATSLIIGAALMIIFFEYGTWNEGWTIGFVLTVTGMIGVLVRLLR